MDPSNLALISEIETFNLRLSTLEHSEILKFSQILPTYRIKSSSTLLKSEDSNWSKANQFINDKLVKNLNPTWEDAGIINKILVPTNLGDVRSIPVYIGNHRACDPSELKDLINQFISEVLPENKHEHPLIWASKVRYWIVTMHPFLDGNGRTSNLICDWILALHGYFPLTFNSKIESHIGGWEGRLHFSDFNYACNKTLQSIRNTYLLFEEFLSDSQP